MKKLLYAFLIVGLFSNFYSLYSYEEPAPNSAEIRCIQRFEAIYKDYTEKNIDVSKKLTIDQVKNDSLTLTTRLPVRLALISHKIGAALSTSLLYAVFKNLITEYNAATKPDHKGRIFNNAQKIAVPLSLITNDLGAINKKTENDFSQASEEMKQYYQKLLEENFDPFLIPQVKKIAPQMPTQRQIVKEPSKAKAPPRFSGDSNLGIKLSDRKKMQKKKQETRNSSSYVLQVLNRYKIPIVLFLVAAPVMYYHRGALGDYMRALWQAILSGDWFAVDRFKRAASWLQMRRGNKT